MRARRGFTIIETLLALLLFEFVMLALSAGAMVAARDLAALRRVELARAAGRNRVERLASAACPPVSSGVVQEGELTEHWLVRAAGLRRLVSDSVVFSRRDGTTGFVIARVTTWCAS